MAHYNIALTLRRFKRHETALKRFHQALNYSTRYRDKEQQCLANAQIGLTYLFMSSRRSASHAMPYLRKSIPVARAMRAHRPLF